MRAARKTVFVSYAHKDRRWADELATFCIHAITASTDLRTKTAVRRLVTLILSGLDR